MAEPERSTVKVFGARAIGLATFLGSPLAGAALWAINEHRVQRPRNAWGVVAAGVLCVTALMFVGSFVRAGALAGASIGLTIAMHRGAQAWHEQIARERPDLALESEAGWKAFVVGLLSVGALFAGVMTVMSFGPDSLQSRIEVRPGAYVYYQDGATEEEARALAARLEELGFFAGDHEVDVTFEGTSSGHAVTLVVDESVLDAELEDELRALASRLQPTTDPAGTLELRLCNEYLSVHHRYPAP